MSFIDDIKANIGLNSYTESVENEEQGEEVTEGLDELMDTAASAASTDLDECGDGELDDGAGLEDEDDGLEDTFDKPESFELSPEEDAEADAMIDVAATPIVLKELIASESVKNFCNSAEFDIAVQEGVATEGMKNAFDITMDDFFTEAQFYNKNMVRFTKQARTNQLFEICVQACARAKGDPIYAKLEKVQKLRRTYKAILRQRYRGPAMAKAKAYIQRLKSSKAPTLAKAANKLG